MVREEATRSDWSFLLLPRKYFVQSWNVTTPSFCKEQQVIDLVAMKIITSARSEPVPNCPNWFPPKVYTAPSIDVHTVCHKPAAIPWILTPRRDETHVGFSSSSVLPCPHWTKIK